MKTALVPKAATYRLPKLAALALFFLGLSTNMELDTSSAWAAQTFAPPQANTPAHQNPSAPETIGEQIHVLSITDAALYRAAFAAQERSDWTAADNALTLIKDKKLISHVLADRYLRREMTLAEAQQWLDQFADRAEAPAIYNKAKRLRGFATLHIAHPQQTVSYANIAGASTVAGFRAANDSNASPRKNHIDSKINAALHKGDPNAARAILTTELQRGTLSIRDAYDIISRIAAAFFYEDQISRARSMAHDAATSGTPLGLWIEGLSAWKQQDYSASSRAFSSLAQAQGLSSWDRAAAAYWAHRAAKQRGDVVQSRYWLAEAAKTPNSFYGHIAAAQAGIHPTRSWAMPQLTAHNIALLSQRASGWQALALTQIGKTELAEAELRRLNPSGSRDLQNAALALAEKAHMPSLTVQLSGVAINDTGKPYEGALYPVPPWQPAGGYKVDRALIYALIRHESLFDPTAISPSGACGLMQIMPATARLITDSPEATKHGSACPATLMNPAKNIELGQKYVRLLAAQPMIGNNLLLLLAAYNGGPGNVARWLDGDNRRDPLLFIESLPMRETRDYVQKVLTQYWMYRSRLSQPETTTAQLSRGEWPRYAAIETPNLELASVDPSRLK